MANTNCTLWSQPDPRCETQGRSGAGVRRAPGQGEIRQRLGKEEVKEGAIPQPTPHQAFPRVLGSSALFSKNQSGRGAGAARARPAWARPLSAVLTPRPSRPGAAAVRGADSSVPLARPGSRPCSPRDGHFMVSPSPGGMDNGDGLPQYPLFLLSVCGEQKVAQRSRGLWGGMSPKACAN